ncbi:MAG: hypothetical protein AAF039_05675 [Bacteroidota bacterium]
MTISKNAVELRIFITSLLIGAMILGLVAYQTYSQDIKEHFSQKMVELLPDMENSLAKL